MNVINLNINISIKKSVITLSSNIASMAIIIIRIHRPFSIISKLQYILFSHHFPKHYEYYFHFPADTQFINRAYLSGIFHPFTAFVIIISPTQISWCVVNLILFIFPIHFSLAVCLLLLIIRHGRPVRHQPNDQSASNIAPPPSHQFPATSTASAPKPTESAALGSRWWQPSHHLLVPAQPIDHTIVQYASVQKSSGKYITYIYIYLLYIF